MCDKYGIDERLALGCDAFRVREKYGVLAAPAEAGGADRQGGSLGVADGVEEVADDGPGDGPAVGEDPGEEVEGDLRGVPS